MNGKARQIVEPRGGVNVHSSLALRMGQAKGQIELERIWNEWATDFSWKRQRKDASVITHHSCVRATMN